MAENARPPVAIRIVRPFDSEEALLENELETIGKTSVVLIGAHPRPTGVILRFEVTLENGATVLRGEGRVLAHKDNAFRGQAGLTLRFTRLDPKSKAVVDRATAMREARAAATAPRNDSPIAQALSVETPEPAPAASPPSSSPRPPTIDQEAAVQNALAAAREKANAQARQNARRTSRPPPALPSGAREPKSLTPPPPPVHVIAAREPEPEPTESPATQLPDVAEAAAPPVLELAADVPESLAVIMDAPDSEPELPAPEPTPVTSIPGEVAASAPSAPRARGAPATTPSPSDASPPNRAELLSRLRTRAAGLPPERIEAILAERRSR